MKRKLLIKRIFATVSLAIVISMIMSGIFVPAVASEDPVTDGNGEISSVLAEDNVIFDAEYICQRLSKPNQTSYSLETTDFGSVVRLVPDMGDGNRVDPYVSFTPDERYSADAYKYVTVIAKSNISKDIETTSPSFTIYYSVGALNYSQKTTVSTKYQITEGWQAICFDLSNVQLWSGDIQSIRIDYFSSEAYVRAGVTCDVAAIIFSRAPADVYDGAYEVLSDIYPAVQTLSDFTEKELSAFSKGAEKGISSTAVSTKDGILRYDSDGVHHDPFAAFYYKNLMDIRGVGEEDRITTEDFSYTVFRYRTADVSSAPVMQLFIYTGEKYDPFRVDDVLFTASTSYSGTGDNKWKSMALNMKSNSTTASAWSGDFNGFRVDWCNVGANGVYLEISDIMFYADKSSADGMSAALNTLNLDVPTERSHDGSYYQPVEQGDGYKLIDAETLNAGIKDSALAKHSLISGVMAPAVRLELKEKTDAPYVDLEIDPIDASKYPYVNILVKNGASGDAAFMLHYIDANGEYSGNNISISRYASMQGWQVLTFNFSELSSWDGNVGRFKLEFLCGGTYYNAGVRCEIGGMVFCESEDAVYDSANYMLLNAYDPVQALDNFKTDELDYFGGAKPGGSTELSAQNGNLVYRGTGGSDPQKMFNYLNLANSRGIKPVTTDVFRYTVVRYRSGGDAKRDVEMFVLTGDAKSLNDMIRIKGSSTCHSGTAKYTLTQTWKAMVVDMAQTDGLSENTGLKYAWNREDGNTKFKGFRMDWCKSGSEGSFLEVSDYIFFEDKVSADNYSLAINSITIPKSLTDPGEDNPPEGGEDIPTEIETEFEEFDPDETSPEETLPDFGDDGTENTPDYPNNETGEESGSETDKSADGTTETDSSDTDADETEEVQSGDGAGNGDEDDTDGGTSSGPVGGDNFFVEEETEEAAEKSEMPFTIACVSLAGLSVASVATVIVIKIKEKEKPE